MTAQATLDLRASERYCQSMARREAKNFYWGFISLPHDQKIAIYALYSFAREVDDEADAIDRPRLLQRLTLHRERVHRAARGEYADSVMQVLAPAMRRYAIPEAELLALVDGVELDFHRTRYETWPELREYCRLVASVVGRMCTRIFGFSDPVALGRADDLGLAMQLVNILRDVREDAALGRIYIPREDLARCGVSEGDLLSATVTPQWHALVRFEAARARELFASGIGVARYIPMRPAACVHTMAGIYERILNKIESSPELPMRGRASLSNTEKLRVVLTSWLNLA